MTEPTSTTSTVAAVVVTYNRKALLSQCLDGILAQSRPVDVLYVIDNASTDGTEELILNRRHAAIKYIRLPQNIGGAGGFHHGMKLAYDAGYEYLWIMDDDVRAEALCLERLLAATCSVLVVVPLHISENNTIDDSAKTLVRPKGILEVPFRVSDLYTDLSSIPATIELSWMTFEGPLIHRSVVSSAGLPRADFFIFWDDTEFSMRIALLGLGPILCVTAARMVRMTYGAPAREPNWRLYHSCRNLLHVRRRYARSLLRRIAIDVHYFLANIKGVCLHRFPAGELRVRMAAWRDSFSDPMKSRYMPMPPVK